MSEIATTRNPTAASVSRALAKAGFDRSRRLRSDRVKGWGHSTAGFRVESKYDYPEVIYVRHVFGDWHRGQSDALPYIEKYAAALRALGYSGEVEEDARGQWSSRPQFTIRPKTSGAET